jgi:sulfopyruvate decarboxylase TPP-binding subunit
MLGMIAECRVPLLMLVTMRGTWAEFNPWQIPMAEATAPVLAAIGCVVKKVDSADKVGATVLAACQLAFNTNRAVAVLMDQSLVGTKEFK